MKLSNVAKNSRQQFNSLAPMGQLGVTGGITGSVPQMDLFSQGAQQARQMTPKPGISGAFDSLQFERYDLPEAPDEEAYQQKKRGLKDMSWAVGLGEGVGALFKAATNFGYNPPGGRLEAGPLIMNDIRALDDEYNRAMENYRAQLAGTQAANVDLANKEMLTNDQLQREKQQIAKADKRYEQQQEYQQGRDAKGDAMNEREFALRERQLANQERQAAFQRKLATLSNRGGGDSRNLSPYIRFALEDERDQLMEQISAAEQAGEFTKVELLTNRLSELEDVDNLKIDQNAFDLDTKGRMVYTQSKFTEHLNKTDWNNPNAVSSAKQKMMDTYREVYPDADPELMESLINRSIQNYKRGLLMNGEQQAPTQEGGEQPPQYTIQSPDGSEFDLTNPDNKDAYIASFSSPYERIKAKRKWEKEHDQSVDSRLKKQNQFNINGTIVEGLDALNASEELTDRIQGAQSLDKKIQLFENFIKEKEKQINPTAQRGMTGAPGSALRTPEGYDVLQKYKNQLQYLKQQANFLN